jgi:HEAT repeat protein
MDKKEIDKLLTTVIEKANLERVRMKELVDRFMNICVNGDPPEYDSLMRQILSEGRACVVQLLKHREEENEKKRTGVLDALGRLGDKSAPVVLQVRLMLSDRHPDVRKQAALAVAALAAATTADELIEILQKRQMEFVDGVALALGEVGDPKAVGPLTTLLTLSTDREARWAAATALGQLRTKDKAAIEGLLAAVLDTRDPMLRASAAKALGAIGEPRTVGHIIRSFQRFDDPEGRAQLLKQLRYFKSLVALEFLVPSTNHDSPDIRKAVIETLKVMTGANAETRDEWESVVNVIKDRPDWQDVDKAAAAKATQP